MAETLGDIAPATSNSANVPGGLPESTNKVQFAIQAWRNIDMTSLVAGLDVSASEIVTYQRDSTIQRKDLAQKTKDFRKLDDGAKLIEYKTLLKAYQTFIDLLTNHSKSINSSFLQTYSALSDAPDPYPLLEAAVDSMVVSEETLPKLTQENERLQTTVSKLTSQLDDTEARLQTERAARKELETNLESKVKEVETSWTTVLSENKEDWTAKEKSLQDKLENQERLLSEIKASYEVNQRLGKSEEADEGQRGHVTSAELDMVHSDLERTSNRLAEVQARNEQLRLDLAQAKSNVSAQATTSLEDDPAYMRVRSENSSLIRKLEASRIERESFKRDSDAKVRQFERETSSIKQDRDALRAKVQKWNDYEEVKSELEVLKSIEFSTGDDDDDAGERDEDESSIKRKGDTLEELLLGRNKKLGEELTILRVSRQDLRNRLQDLQENLSRTNTELEASQSLNEKLENDLAEMQSETANHFPSGASVAGTYVSRYAPSMAGRRVSGGRSSPTSSIISGFDSRGSEREPMGGGSGILPMVAAQRDRFKTRNTQLEQELSVTQKNMSKLRQEVAALQKDNLNLYEKTRYVSTYNRGSAGGVSSSSSYANDPNPTSLAIGTGVNSTVDRYRSTYESNLSLQPFAAFRGRESARAYKRMSFPERVVYSMTRIVLASRTSRNVFAAYCVALHVLVFFALYWLGSADADRHTTNFGQAAAAAAAGARVAAGGRGSGTVSGSVDGGLSHGDWKAEGFEAR